MSVPEPSTTVSRRHDANASPAGSDLSLGSRRLQMNQDPPADNTLDPRALAELREGLRLPVHFIVGFCEGLLEEPSARADYSCRAALGEALVAARWIRALISDALPAHGGEVSHEDVGALYEELREPRDQIVQAIADLLNSKSGAALADNTITELRGIHAAALNLLSSDTLVSIPSGLLGAAAHPEAVAAPAASRPEPEVQDGGPHRILVVEDESGNRRALRKYLERQGHEVVEVENGRQALERISEQSHPFDLVLSDIEMPEMNGIELLGRLKEDSATHDLPVIVVSGRDDMPSVVKCIEGGADDHLSKPFDAVLLRARINAALERKRLRDKEVEYLRQVRLVTEAANAVEAGDYQSGSLSGVARRGDELGRLARVFDTMVSGVQAREARLRSQLGDLKREIRASRKMEQIPEPKPEIPSLPAGELFARRYQVLEEVGCGGMGRVYRVEDRELGEHVAMKTLRTELLTEDPSLVDRFKTELRLARRIAHRNVVRAYDFGESEGIYYLTMEFVRGVTLRSLIDARGGLGISSTLAVGRQLAKALAVAHQLGVIHRDIKPHNLLLDDEGVLKVMDFGVARPIQGNSPQTLAGKVVGTPLYMAPEQLFGEDIDERCDLYSTGVVLYECLTAQLPLDADTPYTFAAKLWEEEPVAPAKINPDVPPALDRLVMRLLLKRPSERLASAEELSEQLRQIQ